MRLWGAACCYPMGEKADSRDSTSHHTVYAGDDPEALEHVPDAPLSTTQRVVIPAAMQGPTRWPHYLAVVMSRNLRQEGHFCGRPDV